MKKTVFELQGFRFVDEAEARSVNGGVGSGNNVPIVDNGGSGAPPPPPRDDTWIGPCGSTFGPR
jgi:hypothetical protein